MPKIRLTRAGFYAWLQDCEPSAVVGRSTNSTWCPISRYLVDCGDRLPVVGRIYRHGVNGKSRLPGWARRFIDKVDRLHPIRKDGFIMGYAEGEITADQALEAIALP